tara:strand:+ start:1048 stop:1560 length:513 start_codon:yes stop_codon:yes gene_type:complete
MSTLKVGTIQDHANSITALSISNAGVLTTGVKHAFYMYRNASQTLVHAGGYTLVQFDAQRINEGNGVTLGASARYTVPSGGAGMYVLHGHGRLNSGNDGNASLGLYLNGTGIGTEYTRSHYYDGMNVSVLRSLSAGDYIEMKMSNSTGGNLLIGGIDQGDTTFMWGYRLG